MKEKLKAFFDDKKTWTGIGFVGGLISPALTPVIHAVGEFVMWLI